MLRSRPARSVCSRTPRNRPGCGQGANIWPCPQRAIRSPRGAATPGGMAETPWRFRLMDRTCAHCDARFSSPYSRARYCSVDCRVLGDRERKREYHAERYRPQVAPERQCLWCGDVYQPKTRRSLLCSEECKSAHAVERWRKQKAVVPRKRHCHKCGVLTDQPSSRRGICVCDDCRVPRSEIQARAELLRRVRRYGLTVEQYDAIWERQGRRCGICGVTEPTKKGWVIDHCHDTGIVRGILCSRCNVGIGMLGDSEANVAKAGWYLANATHTPWEGS